MVGEIGFFANLTRTANVIAIRDTSVQVLTRAAYQSLAEDTPAIAESVPGYDSRGWFGYVAPAGTPKTVVALLNREINRAMSAPDVKEKLAAIGLTVVPAADSTATPSVVPASSST